MKCPIDDSDLREEYIHQGRTGFCSICLKHYPLCHKVRYMAICQKLADHDDNHIQADGVEWNKNFV